MREDHVNLTARAARTDIGIDAAKRYNVDPEIITDNHGPGPGDYPPNPGIDGRPPGRHASDSLQADAASRTGRHTARPGDPPTPQSTVTIQRIETQPMTAADEKEAIDALAALLAHHQRTGRPIIQRTSDRSNSAPPAQPRRMPRPERPAKCQPPSGGRP